MAYKVGDKAEGGIIIYLDKSGKRGIAAAEKDLGEHVWERAIKQCSELTLNGFNDWFLPPESQKYYLILELKELNILSGDRTFWTSTPSSENEKHAMVAKYESGAIYSRDESKDDLYFVVPVRAFNNKSWNER